MVDKKPVQLLTTVEQEKLKKTSPTKQDKEELNSMIQSKLKQLEKYNM